jgi:hypothetical protein
MIPLLFLAIDLGVVLGALVLLVRARSANELRGRYRGSDRWRR